MTEFENIYKAFRPKILNYLSHLVNENEAEDLTQEVFIKVSQSLEKFKEESSLSTWIYKIATNTAYDRMRHPSFRKTIHKDLHDKDISYFVYKVKGGDIRCCDAFLFVY
ncbi:sigma-70 family RNA polymerase sigma factor [Candidatus Poribacteria bacterium]|nr:sigma-70 family RNA polymerase sigma factor [Candidatus Poribacteria bacterium]